MTQRELAHRIPEWKVALIVHHRTMNDETKPEIVRTLARHAYDHCAGMLRAHGIDPMAVIREHAS